MWKIMHFNDFWTLLRYFAFLGPTVGKERKVEFRDQKNPHEPLCFACFLSQRHHLWCLCPLFQCFSVLGVKMIHLMKFHYFSVSGLKMWNEHFCDFEQKYTPETITFIRFWATFPQAWFFIMISFCRKEILFAEFYFPDSFFAFSGKCMFLRKTYKKGMPFPGARARSEPFSSSRAHRKCIFRILLPKVEIIPFWLPNRKIIKSSHFWSKK